MYSKRILLQKALTPRSFNPVHSFRMASKSSEDEPYGMMEVKVTEGGRVAEVITPGFDYTHLNRFGGVDLHHMARIAVRYSFDLLQHAWLKKIQKLKSLREKGHVTLFVVSTSCVIHDQFSSKDHLFHPLLHQVSLSAWKRSSLTSKITCLNPKNGKILFEFWATAVCVDPRTATPVPLPSLPDKTNLNLPKNLSFKKYVPASKPENTFQFPYKVMWSDIDPNFHVNQSVYIRLSTDAMAAAVHSKWLPKDFTQMVPLGIHMNFVGQSQPGDSLLVHLWRDSEMDDVIHIQTDKEGSAVFHGVFNYGKGTRVPQSKL